MHRVVIRTRGDGGEAELDLFADAIVTFSRHDSGRDVVIGVALVLRCMDELSLMRFDVADVYTEDERTCSSHKNVTVWLCADIATAATRGDETAHSSSQ